MSSELSVHVDSHSGSSDVIHHAVYMRQDTERLQNTAALHV